MGQKPECEKYLKAWISERKMTQRVEDLKAGAWFKSTWYDWDSLIKSWKQKHHDWNDPYKRKQLQKWKMDQEAFKKEAEKKKNDKENGVDDAKDESKDDEMKDEAAEKNENGEEKKEENGEKEEKKEEE